MKRFWIILSTEMKAWRRDPVTAMGGLLPPLFILIAFQLMFGGSLSFRMALLNHDEGAYGDVLHQALNTTLSPFGKPYYQVLPLSESEAWQEFETYYLDAVWVIPADFSQRLLQGESPQIEMHFNNFIDDLAKNHRIYQAEVMWTFYNLIDMPAPPLEMAEEYPLPQMVNWFPIIGVGIALVAFMLGGMINIMMLTYKEQTSRIILEFGLSPRSLTWIFVPKILLALLMSLINGTIFLGIFYLFTGEFPTNYLPAVWLLAGLVSLFWICMVMFVGLRARHYISAMIGVILTSMVVFFIGGGLSMIRNNTSNIVWFAWLFPNAYAVDPLRDLILFHSWPVDWTMTLLKLAGFAVIGMALGLLIAARQIRRLS